MRILPFVIFHLFQESGETFIEALVGRHPVVRCRDWITCTFDIDPKMPAGLCRPPRWSSGLTLHLEISIIRRVPKERKMCYSTFVFQVSSKKLGLLISRANSKLSMKLALPFTLLSQTLYVVCVSQSKGPASPAILKSNIRILRQNDLNCRLTFSIQVELH